MCTMIGGLQVLAVDLSLVRSLSLFAPMTNGFLETRLWSSWRRLLSCGGWVRFASMSHRCLRHLWLGPHKLMQKGVSAECLSPSIGQARPGQGLLGLGDVILYSIIYYNIL